MDSCSSKSEDIRSKSGNGSKDSLMVTQMKHMLLSSVCTLGSIGLMASVFHVTCT